MNREPRIHYSVDGVAYDPPSPAQRIAIGERRHDPARGWTRAIPATTHDAHLSGLDALNLPHGDPTGSPGDWHREATWWTPTFMSRKNTPYTATLWTKADAEIDPRSAPGDTHLRDARPALLALEHPAGKRNAPIWCATLAQAAIDLAWNALERGGDPPDRREMQRWLNAAGQREAAEIATRVASALSSPAQRERWERWMAEHIPAHDQRREAHTTHHAARRHGTS